MDKNLNMRKYNNIIINIIIVLFTLIALVCIFAIYFVYDSLNDNNVKAVNYLSEMNSYVYEIDNNVLSSIYTLNNLETGVGFEKSNLDRKLEKIKMYENKCDDIIIKYQQLELSESEYQRFNTTKNNYKSFIKKVNELLDDINNNISLENIQYSYNNEITPLKNSTIALLEGVNNLSSDNLIKQSNKSGQISKGLGIAIFMFGIFLLITINILNKYQKKVDEQLEKSNKTVAKQKNTIHNTLFKDIITDAYNRMSFLDDFADQKKTLSMEEGGYFIMLNLDNFHRVNFTYGNNIGDIILSETFRRIQAVFNEYKIYRTSADEFVVLVKMPLDEESYNKITGLLNNVKMSINKPYQLNPGVVNVSCSINCIFIKGESVLSSSLLEKSAEIIKQNRINGGYGITTFINAENNQIAVLN